MDRLKQTLIEVMNNYTGEALNGYSFLTVSPDQSIYTVVSMGKMRGQRIIDTGLVVRLDDNRIFIEHDVNDKPLVDALLQAGISREQIMLVYLGESLPESAA